MTILTYYFKKKKDLIAAAILQNYRPEEEPALPQTLEELDAFFRWYLEHCHDRIHDFRYHSQLEQLSPEIYKLQSALIERYRSSITQTIDKLTEAGLIAPELFDGQYICCVKTLITIMISDQLPVSVDKNNIDLYKKIWSILLPSLTPKGLSIFRQIQESHRGDPYTINLY